MTHTLQHGDGYALAIGILLLTAAVWHLEWPLAGWLLAGGLWILGILGVIAEITYS